MLACISRARRARSPQRLAWAPDKSHSRLHFAHSTRTISAEGCARMGQIALSPAFRTLDTHDLRRGLRVKSPKRAFRTRLHQKLTRQSLQNERFVRNFLQKSSGNTHHAALPSSFAAFRESSPSKQHPLTRQSQWDNDIHLYHNSKPHDSLRLPRKSHFHTSKHAQSPAPATKSDNIISCKLQQNLHHTTRLE